MPASPTERPRPRPDEFAEFTSANEPLSPCAYLTIGDLSEQFVQPHSAADLANVA
jgi:hypothetical protein